LTKVEGVQLGQPIRRQYIYIFKIVSAVIISDLSMFDINMLNPTEQFSPFCKSKENEKTKKIVWDSQ
jgi:hypothetical protein